MLDIKKIRSKVINKNNINEKTIIMYYQGDLLNIPPFMCSPFSEDWFWSNNFNDLSAYIFEMIISNYLIASISTLSETELADEKYDFIKSCDLYKEMNNDKDKNQVINNLLNIHEKYNTSTTDYFVFIKDLRIIEEELKKIDIYLQLESYISPLEIRHLNRIQDNDDLIDLINRLN